MTTTAAADQRRADKARFIAAGADQWLHGYLKSSGKRVYGIPSSSDPAVRYWTNLTWCSCRAFAYHGDCKHRRAVVLAVARIRAAQQPKRAADTGRLPADLVLTNTGRGDFLRGYSPLEGWRLSAQHDASVAVQPRAYQPVCGGCHEQGAAWFVHLERGERQATEMRNLWLCDACRPRIRAAQAQEGQAA